MPHYLSPLSHHCCDYGCHAAAKRSTINSPEIKAKKWISAVLAPCTPEQELHRSLISPPRRQQQNRRRLAAITPATVFMHFCPIHGRRPQTTDHVIWSWNLCNHVLKQQFKKKHKQTYKPSVLLYWDKLTSAIDLSMQEWMCISNVIYYAVNITKQSF